MQSLLSDESLASTLPMVRGSVLNTAKSSVSLRFSGIEYDRAGIASGTLRIKCAPLSRLTFYLFKQQYVYDG